MLISMSELYCDQMKHECPKIERVQFYFDLFKIDKIGACTNWKSHALIAILFFSKNDFCKQQLWNRQSSQMFILRNW